MYSVDYSNEIDKIVKTDAVYIYGAGDVAREVAFCITRAPYNKRIRAFLVSDITKEKRSDIYGIPILSYKEVEKDALVLIAVLEKYRDEITGTLEKLGILNYCVLTYESDLWGEVRKRWFFEYRKGLGEPVVSMRDALEGTRADLGKDITFRIFVAKSPFDRKLNTRVDNEEWETDIQVGAALTDQKVSDIVDSKGDNISIKNKQYCEMTALYWIWKNTSYDYTGLCHYRRRFALSEDDIRKLCNSDIDIVLTTPIVNIPDVKQMYGKNHLIEDWDVFGDAIEALFPDYKEDFHRFGEGILYVPYNMVIMRRECLESYCKWAFPVFEYIEEHTPKREDDTYQRRNIGFLSERVMSLYLLHHRNNLKMAYCDKFFYE